MSDNEEKDADACKLAATDSENKTNLCCCYVLDPDGDPLTRVLFQWETAAIPGINRHRLPRRAHHRSSTSPLWI